VTAAVILTTSGEVTVRRIAMLAADRSDRPPEDLIVALVTLAEAHVDRCIDALFAASRVLDLPLGATLFREVKDSIHRTWRSRYEWLSNGFNLKISGTRPAQELDTLVELRNSIVHGNGRITDLQSPTAPRLASLKANFRQTLGIECFGRRVVLNRDIEPTASRIGCRFIAAFDGQLTTLFPTVDVES
jgi:hypothetical protein